MAPSTITRPSVSSSATATPPTKSVAKPSTQSSTKPSTKSSTKTTAQTADPHAAPQSMIQLTAVSKHYHHGGGLSNVSLEVPKGQFLWVTGPSGSGKTTLLKLLHGAERPSEGQVWVNQQEVSRLKGDRISRFRRQVGVVFQDYKLIENRTVAENITFVLWAQGCAPTEIQRRLKPTLRLVGLSHKADSFPGQLSGGEQQRVSIARAIVTTPPLLLADEPTGNLDAANAQQVVNILNQLNRMGITVVVTTHNQDLVEASSHPVVHICEGKLHQQRGG